MGGGPRAGEADPVPRIVITGNQPQHLSAADACAWLRSESQALRALPGVDRVVLTQVSGSSWHPRPWAWVCEVHFAQDADALAGVEHPVCIEWLMDLRLLGMRPTAAVLDNGERVL
jgi:hypothetical protein